MSDSSKRIVTARVGAYGTRGLMLVLWLATTRTAAVAHETVSVRPFAGFGVSTRSFTLPVSSGVYQLNASIVPAAEVGCEVVAWPENQFTLAFRLHYQSALGFVVTERPPFALMNEVEARSERVELAAAPGLRIGAVHVSMSIGAIARTLWPSVHTLLTPGYSLIGPHARLELSIIIAGPVSVVVGPEVQWIVLMDDALLALGLYRNGLALGGNVTLAIEASPEWSLSVNYRESHARVDTSYGIPFEDVERYVTVRLMGIFR